MKYLLFLLFIFLSIESKSQCLQANIIFLMDWSGSEFGNERQLSSSVLLFADKLPISETQVQISIISFSSNAVIISELSGDRDLIKFQCLLLGSTAANGSTVMLDATKLAINDLISKDRGARNIIIIISDGDIEDWQICEKEIRLAEGKIPLSTFAVQIGGDENGAYSLIKLTGDKNNVVGTTSLSIVEALMLLNLCN